MQRNEGALTLGVFPRRKKEGRKLAVVTAYDLTSALIASAGGVDAILVGDSVGMVVLGHENTLPVTLEDMIHHCRAVTRARPQVPVIVDMPYGSFHISPEETVRNAVRLVKEGGACAVKIEGGHQRLPVIQALLAAEIPVMGHLGLTPQSVHRLGGYKVQGRGEAAAADLEAEALLLAEAGCFAMVLECVPEGLATRISAAVGIPTIGIGAGAGCDGQVLVFHDMLGLFTGLKPKFVKQFAHLGDLAVTAIAQYVGEVRAGSFPGPEHVYGETARRTDQEGRAVQQPASGAGGEPDSSAVDKGYLADMKNGEG